MSQSVRTASLPNDELQDEVVYILAAGVLEFDRFTQVRYNDFRTRWGWYGQKDKPRIIMATTLDSLLGAPFGFRMEMLPGFQQRTDDAAELMRELCRQRGAVLLNL